MHCWAQRKLVLIKELCQLLFLLLFNASSSNSVKDNLLLLPTPVDHMVDKLYIMCANYGI